MNSQLSYIEFNLLYKRYTHLKDIDNVEYNRAGGCYMLTYSGPPLGIVNMYVHKVDMLDDGKWMVSPMTLSEIFEKYPQLQDIISINEELSEDYVRLIFHKLTGAKFLKYLSDMELIEYENFINRKSQEFNELNEKQVRELCRS